MDTAGATIALWMRAAAVITVAAMKPNMGVGLTVKGTAIITAKATAIIMAKATVDMKGTVKATADIPAANTTAERITGNL
jgi:hypothetical protein